jgi:predicted CopG family antitoxin
MSKPITLSDEAHARLIAQKRKSESLSDVILRLVPRPIRTFGDLEKNLSYFEDPGNVDFLALERLRQRKMKAYRVH